MLIFFGDFFFNYFQGDLGVGHADELFIQFAPPVRKQNEGDAKMTKY